MERRKDFSIIKINKYINGKRKINDSRYNCLNLTQLNGGIISPTNNNNPFRVLSQDKERSQTNENIVREELAIGKELLGFKYWIIRDEPALNAVFGGDIIWNK